MLFVFMAGCICFSSFSQNTVSKKNTAVAQFGITAGVNLANVKSELYSNSTSRIGVNAGIFSHIHLSPHLAIQPELNYSQQGFKQDISSGLSLTSKMDYINIPVLVQYMYKGFRLETGPQIGFLVHSKADYTDGREQNMKEYLQSTDFSWDFGASYLTTAGLGVFARHDLGINNINKKIEVVGVPNSTINNRVWQFGLFYQLQ